MITEHIKMLVNDKGLSHTGMKRIHISIYMAQEKIDEETNRQNYIELVKGADARSEW